MHGSEVMWPTWDNWLAGNLTRLAVCTSKSLKGSHTYSCVFMDLQVVEALEGHEESHFFELIRDVMTNHGWLGGRHRGVEGEKVRTNSTMCDSLKFWLSLDM